MPLLRGMARAAVVSGTATAVSNRVSRRQAQRWAEQEQPYQSYDEPPPQPAAAPPAGTSRLDELKELASLKQQGVLTEQEFDREKARILGS
jgi:hypothetical protein